MRKFLTLPQLSEMLQVPKGTIYSWTHTQFVPHYKLGKNLRFDAEEIDRWLKKRHIKGRATMKIDINTII